MAHINRRVKKLRLAGIADYDEANGYLAEHYIAEHNRRYACEVESADYHRRTPTAGQLDQVFWLEQARLVSEDWVVRYKNRLLQLERRSQHWAPSRSEYWCERMRPAKFRFVIATAIYCSAKYPGLRQPGARNEPTPFPRAPIPPNQSRAFLPRFIRGERIAINT
jgi:hypothetical protein